MIQSVRPRPRLLWLSVLYLGLIGLACATSPTGRRQLTLFSEQDMAQIGLSVAAATTDSDTTAGRATLAALGLGTQYGILLPFSRTHESEADILGLEIMARSGFEPEESLLLWQNMAQAGGAQPPEWMSSHPSHRTRINDLTDALPQAKVLSQTARAAGKTPDCRPPTTQPDSKMPSEPVAPGA